MGMPHSIEYTLLLGSIRIQGQGQQFQVPITRGDSMISAFLWGQQAAAADSVISIEYNSELLNHVSKNWEVLAGRN